MPDHNQRNFNIFEEYLRGVLYRGGPEAEKAVCAHVNFTIFIIILAAILIGISSCCQRYLGLDLVEIITSPNVQATKRVEAAKGTYILDDADNLFWVDERGKRTLVEESAAAE